MTHFQQGPKPDDAVLGGQSSAPPDAAVLGGIEGVKQQFEWGTIEQKKAALDQTLQYGKKGVDFLTVVLAQDLSDEVKSHAKRCWVLGLLEKSGVKNFQGMDLAQADLSKLDLSGANLSGADQWGVGG